MDNIRLQTLYKPLLDETKNLNIDGVDLVHFHFTQTSTKLGCNSKLYLHSERLYQINKVTDESI